MLYTTQLNTGGMPSYKDGVICSDVTVHIHNVFCWVHCAQQLNRPNRRHYEYRPSNQDRTYEHPRNTSCLCRNKNDNQINDQNTVSNKYYSTDYIHWRNPVTSELTTLLIRCASHEYSVASCTTISRIQKRAREKTNRTSKI